MTASDRFTHSEVVVQAAADLKSRPLAAALRVALAIALGAAMLTLTANDVRAIAEHAQRQLDAGSTVWQLQPPPNESSISAAACDALNQNDTVAAAGAIMSGDSLLPTVQPLTTYPVNYVTTGYLWVLWPDIDLAAASVPGSVFVGQLAADNLGLAPGATLTGTHINGEPQHLVVADVLPTSTP